MRHLFSASRVAALSITAAGCVTAAGCGSPADDVDGPSGPVRVADTTRPAAADAGPDAAPLSARPAVPGSPVMVTAETGWPTFRGPNRTGLAPSAAPPLEWGDDENILWRTDLPGRGYSSPVVSAGRVFLTAADEGTGAQFLMAFDAAGGDELWRAEVARGALPKDGMHPESTHATATPVVVGDAVFCTFLHDGKVWASAYSTGGERLWGEVDCGAFLPVFGYAASPIAHGSTVVISTDNRGPGSLIALDQQTGGEVWRTAREAQISFNTPLLATLNGRDTLVVAGNGAMDGYDAGTGDPLWSVPGLTQTISGSAVCGKVTTPGGERDIVIASGGYPGQETLAVFPPGGEDDPGDATVAWRERIKAYVPSPLLTGDLLFLIHDDGKTWCLEAGTGRTLWRARLPSTKYRASPVLIGGGDEEPGRVLICGSNGHCVTFAAGPDGYEVLAEHDLGEELYASPAVVGSRLYLRSATGSGASRQDRLYCVGTE